jgi:hypothetical protein
MLAIASLRTVQTAFAGCTVGSPIRIDANTIATRRRVFQKCAREHILSAKKRRREEFAASARKIRLYRHPIKI